jgi:hypothetical protein
MAAERARQDADWQALVEKRKAKVAATAAFVVNHRYSRCRPPGMGLLHRWAATWPLDVDAAEKLNGRKTPGRRYRGSIKAATPACERPSRLKSDG